MDSDQILEFKLEIFIPEDFVGELREALHQAGAGVIGNYDHCMSITAVRGYWRPLPGANPYLGQEGQLSEGTEVKVEMNCKREFVGEALAAVRRVHPYEEPLINVVPLFNGLFG